MFIKLFINFEFAFKPNEDLLLPFSWGGAQKGSSLNLETLRNSENGRGGYGRLVSGVYGAVAREGHTSRSSTCSRFASRYLGTRRMRRLLPLVAVLGACCRVRSAPAS